MNVGKFLNFGIESAKKNFLKLFIMLAVSYAVLFAVVFGVSLINEKLGSLVSYLLSMIVGVGIWVNVLRAARGEEIDFMVYSNIAPATYLNFAVVTILYTLIMLVGLVALIVPGIVLSVMLFPAFFLVLDKNMGPIEALKQSKELTRGHKMDIFLGVLVSTLVLGVASILLITIPFTYPAMLLAFVYPYLVLTGHFNKAAVLPETPTSAV